MGLTSNRKRVVTKKLPVKIVVKKKALVKEPIVDDDEILLKGEKAELLAEACKLDKEIKKSKKRLDKIKVLLDLDKTKDLVKAGEYVSEAGAKLVITHAEKFTDVDPEKLYNLFVKNRKKKKFFTVVKVNLTNLKKLIPESSIKKLRSPLDSTVKWSFK